jgi:type I restriction enzyme S subunit
MKWSIPKLQDLGRGATFKEISKTIVQRFEIPLPPLEEQKRIAGILDEADLVRKKTQALIDKYDELAQSLFLDMFGDPVTNPKGWEVKPLE